MLRSVLAPGTRHVTAISQGDVTEPNIGEPLCWLDFEHAGRNALAGDAANLLWYLLGMGGWLVPAYQPATYARTLRHPVPPIVGPTVDGLNLHVGHIELDYAWSAGPGRRAALGTLHERLLADLMHTSQLSSPAMGSQRVRAILVTPGNDLLTIRRIRPGQAPYWVLPGGGVEPGEDLETALGRELREEIAATADVHSLLHILDRGDERQYFYLARAGNWSAEASARSGPEFADPARGEYHLQAVPLTADAVAAIDLKPGELAEIILYHLRGGTDLFSLPDLRTASVTHAC